MKKIIFLSVATFAFGCLYAQSPSYKSSTQKRPDSVSQRNVRIAKTTNSTTAPNKIIIVGGKESKVNKEVTRGSKVSLNPQPLPPSDPNKNKSKVSSKKKKIGK
jgi:hypothetical protein